LGIVEFFKWATGSIVVLHCVSSAAKLRVLARLRVWTSRPSASVLVERSSRYRFGSDHSSRRLVPCASAKSSSEALAQRAR
jgi:hypothetical protein